MPAFPTQKTQEHELPSTTPAWPESIFGAPQLRPEPIDWDQVIRELGSDLPSDYRALADTYPAMYLDHHANLLRPGAVWGFELGTFVLATHRGGRAELLEFDP